MKHALKLLAVALVALALMVPTADAAGTHVTAKSWHVYTGSTLHKVAPGGTYHVCPSNPVTELYLKGRVTGAKKGRAFKEIWFVDGIRRGIVTATWTQGGTFTDYFAFLPAGGGTLETGTWKLKIKQAGKKIGGSTVRLPAAAC